MTPRDAIEYGMIDKIVDAPRNRGGVDISDRVEGGKRWNK
jgi:hypothetical protein